MTNQLVALALMTLALGAPALALTASSAMARDAIEAPSITGGAPMTSGFYQESDGTHDSLAAFSREVQGTPCGVTCTREGEMQNY